jgi:hypothetical protein
MVAEKSPHLFHLAQDVQISTNLLGSLRCATFFKMGMWLESNISTQHRDHQTPKLTDGKTSI